MKASASFVRDSRGQSPFFPGSAVFVAREAAAARRRATRPLRRAKETARVSRVSRVSRRRASSSVSFEARLSDSSLCVFFSAAAVSAAAVSAAAVSANARSSASKNRLRRRRPSARTAAAGLRLSAFFSSPRPSRRVVAAGRPGRNLGKRREHAVIRGEVRAATHEGNRRRRRDGRRFFRRRARTSRATGWRARTRHRPVARAALVGVLRCARISRSLPSRPRRADRGPLVVRGSRQKREPRRVRIGARAVSRVFVRVSRTCITPRLIRIAGRAV